mgnify:CR=1 FL=1
MIKARSELPSTRLQAVFEFFMQLLEESTAPVTVAVKDDSTSRQLLSLAQRRPELSSLATCVIGGNFSTFAEASDLRTAVHLHLRILTEHSARDTEALEMTEQDLRRSSSARNLNVEADTDHQPAPPAGHQQQWDVNGYHQDLPHLIQIGTRSMVTTAHKLARFFVQRRHQFTEARRQKSQNSDQLDADQKAVWVHTREGLRLLLEHAVQFFEGQLSVLEYAEASGTGV